MTTGVTPFVIAGRRGSAIPLPLERLPYAWFNSDLNGAGTGGTAGDDVGTINIPDWHPTQPFEIEMSIRWKNGTADGPIVSFGGTAANGWVVGIINSRFAWAYRADSFRQYSVESFDTVQTILPSTGTVNGLENHRVRIKWTWPGYVVTGDPNPNGLIEVATNGTVYNALVRPTLEVETLADGLFNPAIRPRLANNGFVGTRGTETMPTQTKTIANGKRISNWSDGRTAEFHLHYLRMNIDGTEYNWDITTQQPLGGLSIPETEQGANMTLANIDANGVVPGSTFWGTD